MKRRRLLLLLPSSIIGLLAARFLGTFSSNRKPGVDWRIQALRLNELASSVRTATDARALTDFVADIFSQSLQGGLAGRTMRAKIAAREFAAVSSPGMLIPEERLADAWNAFASKISAPLANHVTASEIHNLRDGFLTSATLLWSRGSRNIWSAPAIYATGADGAVAGGCRAIEAIRVLWDLGNKPDNLLAARARVSQGVLLSNVFREDMTRPSAIRNTSYVTVTSRSANPFEIAQRAYLANNGKRAFNEAIASMVDQVLA